MDQIIKNQSIIKKIREYEKKVSDAMTPGGAGVRTHMQRYSSAIGKDRPLLSGV